jgi:hypothetical protein
MSPDREELADELASLSARYAHHADADVRTVAAALQELAAIIWDEADDVTASRLLTKIRDEVAVK